MKKLITKIRNGMIFLSIVLSLLFLATIFEIWTAEPRDFIKEDPFLMEIHPVTQTLLTVVFVILFLLGAKFWSQLFGMVNKIHNELKTKTNG